MHRYVKILKQLFQPFEENTALPFMLKHKAGALGAHLLLQKQSYRPNPASPTSTPLTRPKVTARSLLPTPPRTARTKKTVFIPGIEPGTLSDQSSSCERLGSQLAGAEETRKQVNQPRDNHYTKRTILCEDFGSISEAPLLYMD